LILKIETTPRLSREMVNRIKAEVEPHYKPSLYRLINIKDLTVTFSDKRSVLRMIRNDICFVEVLG